MRRHRYFVYIIASLGRLLYTGMTNNLTKRVGDHKEGTLEGFTSHFRECRLVYWESFDDVRKAIDREKQVKRWRREKKIRLIETFNRDWHDLSLTWGREATTTAWSLDSPQGRLARDDSFESLRERDIPAGFRKVKDPSKRTRPKPFGTAGPKT